MTGRDSFGRFVVGHPGSKPRVIVDVERMRNAFRDAGTVAGAARLLGVNRITLMRRMAAAGVR